MTLSASSGMILREATDDDLPPLHDLARKVWTQLDIPFDTSLERFRALQRGRFRIIVLWDGKAMPAALIAHPIETDRGPGMEIATFVVDQERPDKLNLLDALSLYAMNIAASEGRYIVVSIRPRRTKGTVYGRDRLGMETLPTHSDQVHQIGHSAGMMAHILARRPEWQLP